MVDRRAAVIGDIGGHRLELEAALVELGADPSTMELPAGLVVVQVGDLIHRGPDSAGVIALVDRIMRSQPDQWIQLVGNHEAQYLTEVPRFKWNEKLAPATVRTLQDWWRTGAMQMAAALTAPGGDWLVTHAGLTRGFWDQALGAPSTAPYAARAMNGLIGTRDAPVLFHGGVMIDGKVDLTAGPIWASAGAEVAISWLDDPAGMPFHQAHGHSTIVNWAKGSWQTSDVVAARAEVDVDARHVRVPLGDHAQLSIDPCFGTTAGFGWKPLVIPGGQPVI